VLGLRSLLQGVLERAASTARAMPLASLRVCTQGGASPR
jgi:hypothetical protein